MRQWELRNITDDLDLQPRVDLPAAAPSVEPDRFPLVLWTTDVALRFTSSPAPGILLLGLSPDRFWGADVFDLFGWDDPSRDVVSAHLRAVRGEAVQFELRAHGETFRCWVSPLRGPDGDTFGTICVGLESDDEAIELAPLEAAVAV